ncbi:MAG: autotransporter domain-containing protein [Pseudomonadota bacterium]
MRTRLLAASALWLLAIPASGQHVGDVVVFGDSLSDPGNTPDLSGGVNFPPTPPYVGNRFTNGPVYSELLPGLLGGTYDPSLNFAVGGALTGDDNLNTNRPSFLPGSDLTGVTLPGMDGQVNQFIGSGGRLEDDDLVIVYGGANDVFVAAEAAAGLPADQIPDLVLSTAETAATNIAANVARLNAVGGSYFILPNLPDLGATPNFTVGGADSIELGTGFTLAHNLALDQAAVGLQDQTGANIIVFDVNGIVNDIRANPDRYGITNTTDACIDVLTCVTGDQATQNQFLYFDGVHPTAGIHAQVAQILATTVRAPTTIAAQGDVTLAAGEDFQRALIETLYPSGFGAGASLDTADNKTAGEAIDRPTDLIFLVDHTDGDRDARDGAIGYDDDLTSVTAGLRHRAGGLLSFGAALRIGAGDVDLDGGQEKFEQRQVQIGLSAAHGTADSYVAAFANAGYAEIRNIERKSGIDEVTADASTDGFLYGAGLAAGHRFLLGDRLRFGPEASFRYSAAHLDGYVENGPDFLIQNVEEQDDIKSLVASIGAVAELGIDAFGDDGADDIELRLTGFLDHDLEDGDRTIESAFVTSPTTLTTIVDGGDRTTGRLGAELAVSPISGIELGIGYETLIGDGDRDEHTVFGRAAITF